MNEEMRIRRYTPHTEEECRNVAKRIINLQQENQELKEMQCTYLGTGCKRRIQLLESVLDEIREYITTNTCWDLRTSKVLEILDKVQDGE